MLGKLIKHDFRAFSRTLLPMQIGVLGGGVLAAILTRVSMAMMGANVSNALLTVLSVLSMLFTGVLILAVCASALVTLLLVCTRVQKSFFGDEGYLTFSLPTTVDKLLWSKIIVGAIWIVINSAVIGLTLFIFWAFGTAQGTLMNPSALTAFGGLFRGLGDLIVGVFSSDMLPGMWLMAILGMVDAALFVLLQMLQLFFAVVAGGAASKKHWLLAAIGVYLACSFVLGFVTSVCGVFAVMTASVGSPVAAAWLVLIGALIVLAGLSAALYFWMRHLLTHKLNLQ